MKILFTLIVTFFCITVFAQNNIAVAIAKITPDKKCMGTHLPDYEIVSTAIAGDAASRQAKEALKEKYGEEYKSSNLYIEATSNSSDSYGNFLTIISTNITDKNGCKRFLYGVGFGKDAASSLKSATKKLEAIVYNGGKKFDYKIVKQELVGEPSETPSSEKTSSDKNADKKEGMGKLKRKQ